MSGAGSWRKEGSVTEAAAWYYVSDSEKHGPLSVEQMTDLIRTGSLDADTLVWSSDMAEWTPLARSPLGELAQSGGLADARPATAPSSAATTAGARAQTAAAPSVGPTAVADRRVSGFVDAIATCLRQYATFSGRAARPEYWYFVLFNIMVAIASTVLDVMIFDPTAEFSPINSLTSLALLLPSLAVAARRLHDVDRTAWWILLFLIPVIGWLIAILFLVQRGSPGTNRFGPPPA
jgi:uncharacterized membrane protein YhaH (DUF805 family)